MRRPSRGAPRAKPSFAGRVLSADGKPPTSSGPAPICWNRSAPGARQDKRQATLWPFGDPLTTGSASGTELPCGQLVISTRTKHVWIPAETSTVLQCQVPAWQCNHGAILAITLHTNLPRRHSWLNALARKEPAISLAGIASD